MCLSSSGSACKVEKDESEEESEADVAPAGAPKVRAPRREKAKADRPGASAAVTEDRMRDPFELAKYREIGVHSGSFFVQNVF